MNAGEGIAKVDINLAPRTSEARARTIAEESVQLILARPILAG